MTHAPGTSLKNTKMSMSRVKIMLELDAPEFLRRMPDGTVAKEMIHKKPFTCPYCNGSGWNMTENNHGQLEKKQCEMCLGFGELKAEITVEWKPNIKL